MRAGINELSLGKFEKCHLQHFPMLHISVLAKNTLPEQNYIQSTDTEFTVRS
jgi:hypothetical protein